MKGFKKVLAMLLAVAMVAAMVMGCSGGDDAKEEAPKDDAQTMAARKKLHRKKTPRQKH